MQWWQCTILNVTLKTYVYQYYERYCRFSRLKGCHKLWIYNPFIFETQCRKSLIFQTYIIWSNRIHSLKYLRSTTLEFKDIGFRKAEFVAKTQFLCFYHILSNFYTERRMQKKRSKTIIFKSLFFDSFFPYMYSLILLFSSQVYKFAHHYLQWELTWRRWIGFVYIWIKRIEG